MIMVKFKEKDWHVFKGKKSSEPSVGTDLYDSVSETERKKAQKKARKEARKARKKSQEDEKLAPD